MILKTDTCESCGGQLERKNSNLYQCASCGQKYYISADKLHKVSVQLSAGKIILICAAIVMAISAVAVVGYQFYTGKLVSLPAVFLWRSGIFLWMLTRSRQQRSQAKIWQKSNI